MARFKRLNVLNTLMESGLVPLYYNKDAEIVKQVVQACYKGGARVFEFTNRGDFAHEVFAEVNKWAEKNCPDMILGVGSVVEPGTTSLYLQLGANFIVSPLLNTEMAKICNRRKVAWIPGCASASEINVAEEAGAEIVKIFPASEVGGPSFVKALRLPCPWTNIMPSGGVSTDIENLKAWFGSGACCVGMGSKLFSSKDINSGNFDTIATIVKETLAKIATIRSELQ